MRKLLLLGAALLVSAGIMAQSTASKKIIGASNKYQQVKTVKGIESTGSATTTPAINGIKATAVVGKTRMSSSGNVYTALLSESTCLAANEETGLVSFTHRANTASGFASSGYIHQAFSSDGGHTWDSTTVTQWQQQTGNPGRYPSGIIYNPTGNTTPANAYSVIAGPVLDASGSGWVGGFFASQQFDGTGLNAQATFHATDTAGGVGVINDMPRIFMQVHGDKIFVQGDANTDDGTNYTGFTTVINKGLWDATGDSVIWNRTSHVPSYLTDGSGNPDGYAQPGMIFDETGTNGYLVYIGRDGDATDNLTYLPMIYKTTDGGTTWIKQTAFDWSAIPTIATLASDLSVVGRPMFGSVKDIVLDENGYVHFATYIHGAYSDNIDSLGYYAVYNLWNGIVCDIHQTSTGWDAFVIDTVWSKDVDDANSPITDPLTWEERMQISKSTDGSKLFYVWMDTDTILAEYNLYPDVYVKMYDVTTGTLYPKNNLTRGTDYDANNYWIYAADYAFDFGSYYQVHISTTDLNLSDVGKVNHYYINDVFIDAATGTVDGVSDNMPLDAFVKMYPNPTSSDLNIAFNANASGNYNVVVYNTLGSAVMSENIDVNGAVVRTISLNELPTGIYMVEVSNENGITTKKIMKN